MTRNATWWQDWRPSGCRGNSHTQTTGPQAICHYCSKLYRKVKIKCIDFAGKFLLAALAISVDTSGRPHYNTPTYRMSVLRLCAIVDEGHVDASHSMFAAKPLYPTRLREPSPPSPVCGETSTPHTPLIPSLRRGLPQALPWLRHVLPMGSSLVLGGLVGKHGVDSWWAGAWAATAVDAARQS
jgi:hypothetical protein